MTFTEQQRQIYAAPTGHRFDPLAVERRLRVLSAGKMNELLDQWDSDDEVVSAVAEENLVTVARTAFGFLPLVEDGGVSEADVLDCLVDFLAWLGKSERPVAQQPSLPAVACLS